jgi:hypothetical protein
VKPVTREEGQQLAKEIGASAFCECSAKQNTGLKEVFTTVIDVYLNPKKSKKIGPCEII